MKLSDLLERKSIVIQCHDNPDADALASGFGLYEYYQRNGIDVKLIYSGDYHIRKSNLLIMIKELNIPIEYVESLPVHELLITVDCQYGESNVKKFPANQIAVIDHHEQNQIKYVLQEIRSNYGSCSTLVYAMLKEEGFLLEEHKALSTALYYGLYMDTNGFSEVKHPMDRDLMEDLEVDMPLIEKMINSNFSLSELEIAGMALIRYNYDPASRFAIVRSNPCDPNILGLISDFILQVDDIDMCIVYMENDFGYKLSIRSCKRDAHANDIANYITNHLGGGGGHKKKAGGLIKKSKFKRRYLDRNIDEYLLSSMKEYVNSYDLIDSKNEVVSISDMKPYRKLKIPIGYVKTDELSKQQIKLTIRTLEGDVNVMTGEETYIIIGIQGEIYPVSKAGFDQSYVEVREPYILRTDYTPSSKNLITGETYDLSKYARSCTPIENKVLYAKKLTKTTKVFSKWNDNDYMIGYEGDYLAMYPENHSDCYIIPAEIMNLTYEEVL